MSLEHDMPYPLPTSQLPARPLRPPLAQRVRPGRWMAIDVAVGVLAGLSAGAAAGHEVATLPARLLLAAGAVAHWKP